MQPKEQWQAPELVYSIMFQLQALIELLSEKGIVGHVELLERAQKIQDEIRDSRPN